MVFKVPCFRDLFVQIIFVETAKQIIFMLLYIVHIYETYRN